MLLGSGKVARFRKRKIEGGISAGDSAMTDLEVHMKVKCMDKISFEAYHPDDGGWENKEVIVDTPAKWTQVSLIPDSSLGRPFAFLFTLHKAEGCKKMKVKNLTATAYSGTI